MAGFIAADYGTPLTKNANETDSDFSDKMKWAISYLTNGSITNKFGVELFFNVNAPNYELTMIINDDCFNMFGMFSESIFKSITIDYKAGSPFPYTFYSELLLGVDSNEENLIGMVSAGSVFSNTQADKVSIEVAPYSSGQGMNGGWYLLASIAGSQVTTFDVGYTSKCTRGALDIAHIAEKILPDVSQDEHKSNLIFRNVVGAVNEELKQKILAKGYLSVEFYEGENKVL